MNVFFGINSLLSSAEFQTLERIRTLCGIFEGSLGMCLEGIWEMFEGSLERCLEGKMAVFLW